MKYKKREIIEDLEYFEKITKDLHEEIKRMKRWVEQGNTEPEL